MTVSAISPIAGFSSVGSVGGLDLPATKGTAKTPGVDFASALEKVQGSIDNADQLSQQLATGSLTDIHQYTVAASKAQLGVQMTVALRNQMMSAFQEVMRMQL
jgi:flagellar hook-basal body complex protein FliE